MSGKGLFAVVAWGASFVALRAALHWLNPFGVVAARLGMGAALLWIILAVQRRPLLPHPRDRWICLVLGLVLSAHALLQAHGLLYTSAGHTGWIIGFIPVCVAFGAHLLRQQRMTRRGWVGVTIGTAGIAIVISSQTPEFAQAWFGDLHQIVSCFTWTIYTLAAAGALRRSGPLHVSVSSMTIASVLVGIAALFTGARSGPPTPWTVIAVLFLGLICSGAAYWAWFVAVHEQGPARVGALLYVEPFVTLILGAALLGEPVTVATIIGGITVLIGVYQVTCGTRRQP